MDCLLGFARVGGWTARLVLAAERALGDSSGRDMAVHVVQPPLPRPDQRRHGWQRNTFRCTCCCCSQITKYPAQLVPPWRAQGSGLTRVGQIPGRDRAVRVVQPPLPMLDHRRHDWQRNTFRCTCCCCSQITKYPTQLVPPWRAQGIQQMRASAWWPGATERYASCSHPCPGQTSDDMTDNETPFAARVAVVLKLPSTQHNSYRWGAPREPS